MEAKARAGGACSFRKFGGGRASDGEESGKPACRGSWAAVKGPRVGCATALPLIVGFMMSLKIIV